MTPAKATRHAVSSGAGYPEVPVREAWVGRLDGVAVQACRNSHGPQITFLWTGGRVELAYDAASPGG